MGLLLSPAVLHAQNDAETPPVSTGLPTSTLQVTTQLVLLDVSVEDRKTGERIADLVPTDFQVTEDGETQHVSYLSENRLPLSILLMFDVTDTEQPILRPLANGAQEVLTHLGTDDEVSIMTFAAKADLVQDFTTNRALIQDALRTAAGRHARNIPTYIHEDIFEAAKQVERSTTANSRRVVIFLTDGTSHTDAGAERYFKRKPELGIPDAHGREEAVAEILRSRAVVDGLIDHSWMTYFVGQGWTTNNKMGEVSTFGQITGGTFLPTGKKEVAQHLARLIDTIRQRYTLGYKPSVVREPGTICHVHVELSPAFYARHITLKPELVAVRSREVYVR